jgi:integrase
MRATALAVPRSTFHSTPEASWIPTDRSGIELPSAIATVRLLILTGCGLGEIMTLKWEYVDFAG